MAKRLIIVVVSLIFKIIARIKIKNIENLPTGGPIMITSNHIGILDGVLIPAIPTARAHPNLIVIIAEKYEKRPLFNWAIKHLEFMYIDRFNPDIRTVREVVNRLRNDGFLIIAPEGTRSPNSSLIEGKKGAAYIAAKTNAWVVPMSLIGCGDKTMRERLLKFKKLDITITLGKPFKIPNLPHENQDQYLQKYTDEIMCQIAALLPTENRGLYSQHPRLKEILQI
ncbi:MAG: lysophospholipid acyltransferase family protein [Anaerolineales bacterium]|jgi:1-acyl-sn-glycerol-3-phosphate acyltransferase